MVNVYENQQGNHDTPFFFLGKEGNHDPQFADIILPLNRILLF